MRPWRGGVAYFSSAGNSADAHYEHGIWTSSRRRLRASRSTRTISAPSLAWRPTSAGTASSPGTVTSSPPSCSGTIRSGAAVNDYDIYIFDADGTRGQPGQRLPDRRPRCDAQDGNHDPMEVAFIVNEFPANAGRHRQAVLHGHRPLLRRSVVAARAEVQRLLRRRPGQEHRRGQHLRPRRQPRRDGGGGDRRGREHRRHAPTRASTSSRIQLARTVADLLHAGGAPAVEVRRKPNTTAVDGTSVTGVNFVTPFFGTSASAPHAAAVAGLLKDVDPGPRAGRHRPHPARDRARARRARLRPDLGLRADRRLRRREARRPGRQQPAVLGLPADEARHPAGGAGVPGPGVARPRPRLRPLQLGVQARSRPSRPRRSPGPQFPRARARRLPSCVVRRVCAA